MRRYLVIAAVLAAACSGPAPTTRTPAQQAQSEMRTINDAVPPPAKLDGPQMLTDEAPPPKPKVMPWETATAVVFSPEDEKVRAALPFTPGIAMDPIDGSKLSIRAATPTLEYKGKIYYFSSEANKATFQASPDQYLTGRFTRL